MMKGEQRKMSQIGNDSGNGQGMRIEENSLLLGSLNKINKVIAVMSGKGGVGKSSVSSILAATLSQNGYQVGILDADITGPSIAKAFGVKAGTCTASQYGLTPPLSKGGIKILSVNLLLENEDDPVIWRGPLIAGAIKQFWEETNWENLDYLVVDLPPGTGDAALTVLQSIPVTGVVIVSSPQDLSLMVVKKAIKMVNKLDINIIGLVENMSYVECPDCGKKIELFANSSGEKVSVQMSIPFLGSIPWDNQINILMDSGEIEFYERKNRLEAINKIVDLI
jgi:Mrp family chromosome partitioning ATPase